MAETVFWWVFTGAGVFVFFLGLGMVEDLVRQWRRNRRFKEKRPAVAARYNNLGVKGNGKSDFLVH